MSFALCPDDGPPRLIRYTTLGGDLLATLDRETNVLLIDRDLFNQLSPLDQQRVLTTHKRLVYARDIDHPTLIGTTAA